MTRFVLTWIAFATLPLAVPRGGSAAELRSSGESTRPASQLEVHAREALARNESRWTDPRPTDVPPLASGEAARPDVRPTHGEPPAREPRRSGPPSRSFRLPEARAPPA